MFNAYLDVDASLTLNSPRIGRMVRYSMTAHYGQRLTQLEVALSRAREGMFVLGNAEQLSGRSNMWKKVIEELCENDSCGPALPVACHQHPESVNYISEPGQLPSFAPDGA